MHVCMIDENSHYSQHQPKSARKYYAFSLENVHPSKVFRLILSCPRTKPQEPRRPRFSFFYLHNVKELTIPPSPASIVIEDQVLIILSENMTLLLVAQQVILLCQKPSTVGAKLARRRQRGGLYSQHIYSCQHPLFNPCLRRFLCVFSDLLRCPEPFGAAP